jgi:hypothetical protein
MMEATTAPVSIRIPDPVLMYQASLVDPRLGMAIGTVVVQAAWPSLDTVADFLGFDGDTPVEPEEAVEYGRVLLEQGLETAPSRPDATTEEIHEAATALARQLAFGDVIPWRESPLSGESLAGLMTKAGALGVTGFGALLGSYAGNGPLLLVTVPAGIIIVGAATGIGNAMRDGLYEKVLRLLDPESQDPLS